MSTQSLSVTVARVTAGLLRLACAFLLTISEAALRAALENQGFCLEPKWDSAAPLRL